MTEISPDTVFVAEALRRFPCVFASIETQVKAHGLDFRTVAGTRNIWIRDWAPTPVGDHFVKFRYRKDEALYPQLHVPESCWSSFPEVRSSPIVLDGGNVVRHGDKVLMTKIVFKDNPEVDAATLCDDLEEDLEAEIVFIPVEPGDHLGHADGIVKWINDKTCFVNDYHATWVPELQDYGRCVERALRVRGIRTEHFPLAYAPHLCSHAEFRVQHPEADDFNPAVGYSINALHVRDLILYPKFGMGWRDRIARDTLRDSFPGVEVKGIQCRDLAMEGGAIHCVTWEARIPV